MSVVKISFLCPHTVLSTKWLFEFLFFSCLAPSLLPSPTLYTLHKALPVAQSHLNNVAWSHLTCFTSTWKSGGYIHYYFIYDHTNSSINDTQDFCHKGKMSRYYSQDTKVLPQAKAKWLARYNTPGRVFRSQSLLMKPSGREKSANCIANVRERQIFPASDINELQMANSSSL